VPSRLDLSPDPAWGLPVVVAGGQTFVQPPILTQASLFAASFVKA
jgi:hypothetical protein